MNKILALTLLAALAIAVPTLAQSPPPQGPGGAGGLGGPVAQGGPQPGPAPDAVLKDVLAFSDDQLTALKALLDTRKQAADTLMPQLMDAEKTLGDALKATSPDATQLGTLLLNVQGFRTQLTQANETFRTAFAKLLTAAQQQKLDQITSLRTSLQAGEALQRLGL